MTRLALSGLLLSLFLPACGGGAPTATPTAPGEEAPTDPATETPTADAVGGAPASAPSASAASAAEDDEPSELAASIVPATGPALADAKSRKDLPMNASMSSVDWIVLKDGDTEVKGRFSGIGGSLSIDPKDLRTATGEIGIDMLGISTGDEARDGNISKLFFGAGGKEQTFGQVTVTGLRPEAITLAVGEKTRALAQMGFNLGGDAIGADLPLEIERVADDVWKLSTMETFTVNIEGMGMGDRKAALLKACAHKSIGDVVTATGFGTFGPVPPG